MKQKLGRHFVEFDVPAGELAATQTVLSEVITSHKTAVAFSSHTARLPVPKMPEVSVEPIVFVRHPLLRLKSIYAWLKKTNLKTRVKSFVRLSRPSHTDIARRCSLTSRSFEHWVAHLLNSNEGRRYISNAQSRFLSGGYDTPPRRKYDYISPRSFHTV